MTSVTSKDGTSIAYDRSGSGPTVILVGGGLDDGSENAPLAAWLARHFTVYNYARRGRGQSGDTLPYAVEREFEDIEALAAEAGGPAHLFGASSGGGLVLEAAAAGVPVDRLAVYDVPYCVADGLWQRAKEYVERLGPVLAAGRRDEALELFMWLAGSSAEDIAGARSSPYWPAMVAVAHTLAYDAACMGDYRPPTDRLAAVARPTLVVNGGRSADSQAGMGDLPADFFDRAADAIAASVPGAVRGTVEGQGHVADPASLGPVLTRFFTD
ncbi:MAG: alpha/beta fold hydrolase [Streptosporangiales bacterium]|nr:alpha/beta fold hydrolase [Streptosporangiales bacterium]